MTGEEVRQILREHRVSLSWLSKELNVTPQCLNARLKASVFKKGYLQEISSVLKKDIFGLDVKDTMQPVFKIAVSDDMSKELSIDNYHASEFVSVPSFSGCVGIIYYGKDAAPKYDTGDIIFLLPCAKDIITGRNYFLVTHNARFIRTAYVEENEQLRLSAINTQKDDAGRRIYDDVVISNSSIIYAYPIAGAIIRNSV